MRLLGRWLAISTGLLVGAVALGCLALAIYARRVTAPTNGGISASEYGESFYPLIADSTKIGLLALLATCLYWLAGMIWVPALRRSSRSRLLMKLSLALLPVGFAIAYAAISLATVGPDLSPPMPTPGG